MNQRVFLFPFPALRQLVKHEYQIDVQHQAAHREENHEQPRGKELQAMHNICRRSDLERRQQPVGNHLIPVDLVQFPALEKQGKDAAKHKTQNDAQQIAGQQHVCSLQRFRDGIPQRHRDRQAGDHICRKQADHYRRVVQQKWHKVTAEEQLCHAYERNRNGDQVQPRDMQLAHQRLQKCRQQHIAPLGAIPQKAVGHFTLVQQFPQRQIAGEQRADVQKNVHKQVHRRFSFKC